MSEINERIYDSRVAPAASLPSSVEALLDEDERLVGAFVAIRGARPGAEALAQLAALPVLFVAGGFWFILASVVAFAGVASSRRNVAVGLTDRNVVRIEMGFRKSPGPDAGVVRLARGAISPPGRRTGDQKFHVGGDSMWVPLRDTDEAVRLARLGKTDAETS
ncbi:MAG: hypothetical protein R2707_09010 [Acidimicrobiales bacterium]